MGNYEKWTLINIFIVIKYIKLCINMNVRWMKHWWKVYWYHFLKRMGIWGKQIITLHFKKLILWNIIQWTYYHHVHMLSTLFPYGPPHMIRKHSSLKSSQPYADYACKIF
jgi:hypothetical protein